MKRGRRRVRDKTFAKRKPFPEYTSVPCSCFAPTVMFRAAAHADVAWAVHVRVSAGCGAKKLMEEAGVKA